MSLATTGEFDTAEQIAERSTKAIEAEMNDRGGLEWSALDDEVRREVYAAVMAHITANAVRVLREKGSINV